MKFDPRNQTICDYVSDDILKEFLNQLPWQKDLLLGGLSKTYKDVAKLDQISEATFKIKKGTMSGRYFVKMLEELPKFDFDKHLVEFYLLHRALVYNLTFVFPILLWRLKILFEITFHADITKRYRFLNATSCTIVFWNLNLLNIPYLSFYANHLKLLP